MKIAVYKDTLANNRGADVAVRNLVAGLTERGHAVELFEKPAFAEKIRGDYEVIIAAGTNEILDIAEATVSVPVILQFHTDPAYQFRHWLKKWRRNRAIKSAMRQCAAIQVLRDEHVAFIQKIAPGIPVSVIGNWSSFENPSSNLQPSTFNLQPHSPSTNIQPSTFNLQPHSPSSANLQPSTFNLQLHTIVYPAAVNKDKNQQLLTAAFETLKGDFPDWHLELYGKGTVNGFCDLREVYAGCAFVAFPSKTEGFPLTVIESAVFGKPCVMIKDWIGTGAAGGGVVTEATVKAYAEGLRKLMADNELRARMGARAKEFCAEHYSRAKILDRWEELISSVASNNK